MTELEILTSRLEAAERRIADLEKRAGRWRRPFRRAEVDGHSARRREEKALHGPLGHGDAIYSDETGAVVIGAGGGGGRAGNRQRPLLPRPDAASMLDVRTGTKNVRILGDTVTFFALVAENADQTASASVVLSLKLTDNAGTSKDAARIVSGKEALWTSTGSTRSGFLAFYTRRADVLGERMRINSAGQVGLNKTPSSALDISLATEDLEVVDAGSTGATEQDWVEVQVGGNTGYLRVYATK
jgi:hypothetical protein